MNTKSIELVLNKLRSIAEVIEGEFANWKSVEAIPYNTLFEALCEKLQWTPDDLKQHQGTVRWYISQHDEWTSVRGLKGGVQRRSLVDARKAAKDAQKALTDQVRKQIEEVVANSQKE